MEVKKIRSLFPMLQQDIVYLDNGALVQKPISVINAMNDFYTKYSISNRTSDSKLGIFVNDKINQTKRMCAQLIDAFEDEIIFNSGTTEGLNYSAQILTDLVSEGEEIIISQYNHSSHIIPWIELGKRKKLKLVFSKDIISDINAKTKIICLTQVNNNFNIEINLQEVKKCADKVNAIIVNDVAQAISHEKVSSKYADIIAFSANKFFGPTGLGVLYVKQSLLNKIESKKYGGGAVDRIEKDGSWKRSRSVSQHEPGTLNIAAIFGLYEAIVFFNSLDLKLMQNYLFDLSKYLHLELHKLSNIKIYSNPGDNIVLIDVINSTAQDVASYLGHKNIYVRSGLFCAKYLEHIIDKPLLRISLHFYNNKADVDTLIKALKEGGDFLDFL